MKEVKTIVKNGIEIGVEIDGQFIPKEAYIG